MKKTDRIIDWLLEYRHWLTAVLLFCLLGILIVQAGWVGDFWEHAAVIREWAAHPSSPQNPVIASAVPSAYFSPYHQALAGIARLFDAGAAEVLFGAAWFNLVFILISIYCFVRFYLDTVHFRRSYAYTLLFLVFLWPGSFPFHIPSFTNIYSLMYTLPYPASFGLGLFFLFPVGLKMYLEKGAYYLLPLLASAFALALLVHPATALAIGLFGFFILVKAWKNHAGRVLPAIGLGVLALVLVVFYYPWFPVLQLFTGKNEVFQASSKEHYQNPLYACFWILALFPVLFLQLRARREITVLLTMGIFLLIYILGGLSGQYGLGRILAYFMLLALSVLARAAGELEGKIKQKGLRLYGFIVLGSVLFIFSANWPYLRDLKKSARADAGELAFLSAHTRPRDIVLCNNLYLSPQIAALGGKTVASAMPVYFLEDEGPRREDVNRFFAPQAPDSFRLSVIRKYGVSHLLLCLPVAPGADQLPGASLIYSSPKYLLYKLNRGAN